MVITSSVSMPQKKTVVAEKTASAICALTCLWLQSIMAVYMENSGWEISMKAWLQKRYLSRRDGNESHKEIKK